MSCGVGRRCTLDPELLLWLWRRPVATAPIRPLAWEPPYAAGVVLKSGEKIKLKSIKPKKELILMELFLEYVLPQQI